MPTFNIHSALAQLSDAERNVAQQRINLIYAAQRQQGMEPRDDSILTYKYGIGELSDDVPSAIATELVLVDKICNKTMYCEVLQHVMRCIARCIRTKYQLNWTDAWEVTRFYVPSILKLYYHRQL